MPTDRQCTADAREDLIAFAREALGLPSSATGTLTALSKRGSDRAYFRFEWDRSQSAVLARYDSNRIENSYFGDIARFLLKEGIPVPQILREDTARGLLLMQDLGNADLWTFRDASWDIRGNLYRQTLTAAHKLHSISACRVLSERVKLMEPFDSSLYQWERDYFRNHFVKAVCGLDLEPDFSLCLENELSLLADRLHSGERCLIHRDLQSQNVMIFRDKAYLIDFQGMRFGSRFYDLGSLLCDPYVSFSQSQRAELLSYYHQLCTPQPDWDCFQKTFWEASAQRLMQAMGAYGFLGLTKGLAGYLQHIPAGIRNLMAAAENARTLPFLLKLCKTCENKIRDLRFETRD